MWPPVHRSRNADHDIPLAAGGIACCARREGSLRSPIRAPTRRALYWRIRSGGGTGPEASSMPDPQVVVIGGGPAGSTVSALIAERGHRVVLFERERFPRFHIGESLIPETHWVRT